MARLALSLAGLLLAILAVEILLRTPWLRPPQPCGFTSRADRTFYLQKALPGGVWALAPEGTLTFCYDGERRQWFDAGGCVSMHVNRYGYRGRPIGEGRSPGVARIVFLGDSFTFGYGVPDGAPYPDRVQEQLAEKGVAAEVLNFGVPGYGTAEELSMLSNRALAYGPDVVVLGYFLNDATGVNTHPYLTHPEPSSLDRRSVLFRLLHERWVRYRRSRELIHEYEAGFSERSESWRSSRRALADLGTLSRERGVRVLVAIFPVLFRLDESYPFKAAHEAVARACRERGLDALDLLPAFLGRDGPSLWVHPCDQHPNPLAHGIAARAITEGLLERGWLPLNLPE